MTQRVIRVSIDSSGAKKGAGEVDNALEGINKKTKSTGRGFSDLRGLIAAAAGAAVIKQFINLSDTFTNIGNRIKLVTDDQNEFNTVQNELIALSQETRTGLEGTVELFARAARATEDLGLSQREVIDLTRTVNQAIQVSGATAEQAANGTLQLAQALQGGIVRAEEFNSIVEQTPRLAEALATGLGVTRGELRKLVVEGKLTSEELIEALGSQAGALQSEFDQLAPTVAQGFTSIANGLLVFVGRVNEGLGSTSSLASLLQDFGNFLVDVSENVFLFANAFKANFTILIANSVAFVDKLVIALGVMADSLGIATDALNPFSDTSIEDGVEQLFNRFEEGRVKVARVNKELEFIVDLTRENADKKALEFITSGNADLDETADALNKVTKETEEQIKAREKAEAATLKFTDSLKEQIAVIELERALGDDAALAIESLQIQNRLAAIATNANTEAARELIAELLRLKELQAGEEIAEGREATLEALRFELELLQATEEQRLRLLAIQQLGLETEDLTTEAIKAQIEEFVTLTGQIEDLEEAQKNQLDFQKALNEETAQFFKSTLRDFFSGTIDDFDSLRNNFGQLLQDLAADFLASAFVEIVADFFKNLAQGQGGILGQVFGAVGGLLGGKQFGGFQPAGVPTKVNEGRQEVFIPSESGQIQPIGQFNGQAGDQAAPTIIIERDAEAALATTDTAGGQAAFRVQVEENQDFLRQQLGLPT